MDKILAGAFGALALIAVVFFIVILSTLMGAVAGWIVGLLFGETILTTLSRFGVNTLSLQMWQLGATLAFVGSFFKAYRDITVSKK